MNGDWPEMQKLVISKMTEHSKKLDRLHDDLSTLKTHVAIMSDRDDRELKAAKGATIKYATGIGALVSAFISGLWSFFRE
jgi:hypothetical protein